MAIGLYCILKSVWVIVDDFWRNHIFSHQKGESYC